MRVQETLYQESEPVEIVFVEDKKGDRDVHGYTVLSPEQYAGRKESVTTLQGIVAKPELIQWAANMATEHIRSNGREVIGQSMLVEYAVTDEILEGARYAHRKHKESAGDVGSRVHDWIDQFLGGEELPYEKDMEKSIKAFLGWYERNQPETLFHERIIYSKELDYAGKLDWGGVLRGRYGLIDFKTGSYDKQFNPTLKRYTGKVRARSDHYMQNAGYDLALTEELGRSAEFYGVLYIRPTGELKYFETTEVEVMRNAFTAVVVAKRALAVAKKVNNWETKKEVK